VIEFLSVTWLRRHHWQPLALDFSAKTYAAHRDAKAPLSIAVYTSRQKGNCSPVQIFITFSSFIFLQLAWFATSFESKKWSTGRQTAGYCVGHFLLTITPVFDEFRQWRAANWLYGGGVLPSPAALFAATGQKQAKHQRKLS